MAVYQKILDWSRGLTLAAVAAADENDYFVQWE
jgi:hypothetical protein